MQSRNYTNKIIILVVAAYLQYINAMDEPVFEHKGQLNSE